MSDSNYVRQRDTSAAHGQTRDLTYPPLPEALTVPVYDNHTHLEIADASRPSTSPSTSTGRAPSASAA